MEYRTFGRTGWSVSEIAFGGWQLGGDWGPVDDDDASIATLLHAFDRGINFVDTAELYGAGHSEPTNSGSRGRSSTSASRCATTDRAKASISRGSASSPPSRSCSTCSSSAPTTSCSRPAPRRERRSSPGCPSTPAPSALARRSVAYLPLGSLEYHSHHLPIGLDGLTAHGICLRAAARAGGLVLPTLYAAVGGDHTRYPWTIMVDSDSTLRDLLTQTLHRLDTFGVEVAVLFSGHFADEQLALVDDVARTWNSGQHGMRVLAPAVNRSGAAIPPDHAGPFETSLLAALHPDRVHLDRLGSAEEAATLDQQRPGDLTLRHAPGHPLRGIMGPDPRPLDAIAAAELLEDLVSWTVDQLDTFTQ